MEKKTRDIRPLAERCRPSSIKEFMGQQHLLGEGKIIARMLEQKTAFSIILWGEPGCGKTTLARLIAEELLMESYFLSAISSGVGDVRKVIEKGRENKKAGRQTLLFLDEIHRFNKAQQDAVLGAVESGDIVLIGATTENPSFQVIAPLLSRVRVVRMYPLSQEDLRAILNNAVTRDVIIKDQGANLEKAIADKIIKLAQGDARRMLNVLEQALMISPNGMIDDDVLEEAIKIVIVYYDRAGDRHYDTISALIKSMRGSDPNASIYYLARMLAAGEDPEFIARRMVIFASEDIGNASPNAISIATSILLAVKNIGMPEAEILLAHGATFLASCPKSNASYMALNRAREKAGDFSISIPLHLRNAPTSLMRNMGYGKDYKYPHDYEDGFVNETYLPDELAEDKYYEPTAFGSEKAIRERLQKLWPKKYNK